MNLQAYSEALARNRLAFLLIPVFIIAGLWAGLPKLTLSTDFDIYFSDDNPQLAEYQHFERVFSPQENVSFFVVVEDGDIFQRDVLELLVELTDAGWTVPYSQRVTSLANHNYTTVDGDFLNTDELLLYIDAMSEEEIRDLREIVIDQPNLVGNLVGRSFQSSAVSISLTLPDDSALGNEAAVAAAREIRDELATRHPGVRILVGGSAATNVTLTEAVGSDVARLMTISYAVIILGLALLLRSVMGTLATLAVITLSVSGTLGLFGWLGYTVSPATGFVPSIVMTIAVADSVHMLVTWFHERRHGATPAHAMHEALRVNAQPIFLTSLTTAIGVLSLNFSDSPPYRDLGNMVAVGVAFAWLLTMTLMPALLMLIPGRIVNLTVGGRHPMERFADWVVRYRTPLLALVGLAVVAGASMITRNELTERWHEYFGPDFEIREVMDEANDRLGGIHSLQFLLDSSAPDGINDPDYLAEVDAFGEWMRGREGVGHVSNLADTVKHLNRIYNADDPSFDRVPESRELAAQFLLLYELSLPTGMGLDTTINVDRSASRMSVLVARTDSERLLALDRDAQAWLTTNAPHIQPTGATGLDMMFAHINHRNIMSRPVAPVG